jgi:hypothetical protein
MVGIEQLSKKPQLEQWRSQDFVFEDALSSLLHLPLSRSWAPAEEYPKLLSLAGEFK